MGSQITVDWENRLRQRLVTLWSGAQLIAERLWRMARPYVPVTQPFNRYYQQQMGREAQRRRQLLMNLPDLPGLDGATKRHLLPRVRHYGNRFAAVVVWHDVVIELTKMSGMLVFLGLLFAFSDHIRWFFPPEIYSRVDATQFTGGWLLLWPVYAASYGLILMLVFFSGGFLLFLPLYVVGKRVRYLTGPSFGIGWPVGVMAIYAVLFSALAIPQAVAGYVTIGGLIWLVLALLVSLDSSLHAKVRIMQDVAQSVPLLSKWLGIEKRL